MASLKNPPHLKYFELSNNTYMINLDALLDIDPPFKLQIINETKIPKKVQYNELKFYYTLIICYI